MASIPEEYFKLYTGKGAASLLHSLPEQEDIHWENEHREFKTGEAFNKILKAVEPKERDAFTNDLRATWAEVIGAFGNTGGGILIFGIHAKAEGGIDKPQAVVPVSEPSKLVTRLKKWALDATDPPLEGIKYEIVKSGENGAGFVVCLIPEGKQKPYRSSGTKKEFYIRVDDNCISRSLSLLKQLFTPQKNGPLAHCGEGMPIPLDKTYINPDYCANFMCGWDYSSKEVVFSIYFNCEDSRQMKAVIKASLPLEQKEYSALLEVSQES